MASRLERSDFQCLVNLFAEHQDFRTEDRRWELIDDAFHGIPRASAASGRLLLGGTQRNAAVALVSGLSDFGCLGDRHSLALVLEALRSRGGDDWQPELDRLIALLDAQCRPGLGQDTADILHL